MTEKYETTLKFSWAKESEGKWILFLALTVQNKLLK